MWPLAIVEVHPVVDDALGSEAVGNVLKVDRFIFERPSETFDEDVVHVLCSPKTGSFLLRVSGSLEPGWEER